jgi:glucokinase-like ROK family protein
MVELNPKSFYSIGVDMDVNYISIVLMDITNEVSEEKLLSMPESKKPDEVMDIIGGQIRQMISIYGIDRERLLGIGFSIPGMIDRKEHRVVLAPNLEWEDVDVRAPFSKLLNTPIYLENEAMASAIGENWMGSCQGINHFVCINIHSGIGSGIFIDGKPYHGAGGSTGEVGHITVDDNGPKCGCGNYVCLETIASIPRIIEYAQKLVRQGIVSKLNDIDYLEEMSLQFIISAARNGDEIARNILVDSARYIGLAVCNIANILNPERIVFGKEFILYSDIVMEQIKNIVQHKALKKAASDVELATAKLGDKASVYGAAIIPIKKLFGK